MPKCPNCKAIVSDKITICTECGTRFNNPIKNTQLSSKNVIKEPKIEKPSKSQTNDSVSTQSKTAEIPYIHYLYLIVSIFFGIFWFIPLIGVFLSYAAYSSLDEQQSKGIDVGSHLGLTIAAGFVHALYVVVRLVMG